MTTRKPKGFNAQTPVIHSSVEILSIKDGAYKQAASADTVTDFAKYMIEQVKGFGTKGFKLSVETLDELNEGWRLRYSQRHPAKTYGVIGGNYIPMDELSPDQADKVKEKTEVGVAVAFAFSTHDFGKLKNDRPNYHAVISEWRKNAGTYCSNRKKDLEAEARRILTGGAKNKRKANLNFAESVDQAVEAMKTKLTKCISLKDNTADKDKFNKALSAFLAVWKA